MIIRELDYERSTAPLVPVEPAPRLRNDLSAASFGIIGGVLLGAGLLIVGFQIGYAAGALLTDYRHLAWLVPFVTFLVAWGNRRTE